SSIKRPNAATSAAKARKPRPTSMCRILISAMIRSVRQSALRFLTTLSLSTSMPPQNETDDDAEREGGRRRRNRTFRDQRFDMVFLFAQGLGKLVKGALYLVSEGVRATFGGVGHASTGIVQELRHFVLE